MYSVLNLIQQTICFVATETYEAFHLSKQLYNPSHSSNTEGSIFTLWN